MENKENPWTQYFASMDEEKNQADIDYVRILKEDEDKTYMDILPPDFKNTKRSIIKRGILEYIPKAVEMLNNSGLFEDRKFTEKDVVRYTMRGTKYSNFYLAHKFIPRVDSTSLWMRYAAKHKAETGKELDDLYKIFRKECKETLDKYDEIDSVLRGLTQLWENYEMRQKVSLGQLINSYDTEEDGFPRTSRGNLCYLFIPVKGKFPKNKTGSFNLYNPRTKRTSHYKILKYKAEDDIYLCSSPEGKEIFLSDYESVKEAWSCLFSINKEIYSGWWNKIMEIK